MKQIGQDANVDEEQLHEYIWQDYVRNSIIASEAEKLGLSVTDKEMQDILAKGEHPLLQRGNMPYLLPQFFNAQTGIFDFNNVAPLRPTPSSIATGRPWRRFCARHCSARNI